MLGTAKGAAGAAGAAGVEGAFLAPPGDVDTRGAHAAAHPLHSVTSPSQYNCSAALNYWFGTSDSCQNRVPSCRL